MTFSGIGDLARHLTLSRQHTTLNAQLDRLTDELASGRKADVAHPVTGGYSLLGDIARSERLLAGFAQGTAEAALFSEARQSTLEKVQENSQSLASDLLLSVSATQQTLPSLTSKAKAAFQDLVSSMNTSINNKSLFAGTATDGPALAPADDILTHLQAEVAGATTAQQARDAIETWFRGAGFESDGYLGNNASIDFQVSEGVLVSSDLNAGSSAIVDLLAETAIAAMAMEIPGLDQSQSRELLQSAGEGLSAAQDKVTGLRGDLGVVQERIEVAETRNLAQKSALEIARSEITSSDPFETATALENTRLQLEALYTVTARLSGLSLTSFLR